MVAFAVTAVMLASSASHQDFPVATRILDSASVKPMLQVNRPAINMRENKNILWENFGYAWVAGWLYHHWMQCDCHTSICPSVVLMISYHISVMVWVNHHKCGPNVHLHSRKSSEVAAAWHLSHSHGHNIYYLEEFHYIWDNHMFGLKDKLTRIWWSQRDLKVFGHNVKINSLIIKFSIND